MKKPAQTIMNGLSLAERTGLEPATPGVTGRYSNQLNYRSSFYIMACKRWLALAKLLRPVTLMQRMFGVP